jgi:dephospho-CoA kinase
MPILVPVLLAEPVDRMHRAETPSLENRPFTVVLTGGIASGKTAVSNIFEKLGVPIIDTDRIAREIVKPGQPALAEIKRQFGDEYLKPDGSLDRAKMREKIFSDSYAKARLQDILHPIIAAGVSDQVTQLHSAYCILVVPLFAEFQIFRWVDWILVVDVPEGVQVDRLQKRDGISFELAHAILDSQSNRKKRLSIADDVIVNTGSLSELETKVEALHRKYLTIARDRNLN